MFDQQNQFVKLKDYNWFKRQKHAGRCVSHILRNFISLIAEKPSNLSLKDIEAEAIRYLKLMDCTATFLGYKGFPGAVCLSVNEQLVHGIPTDYVLKEGDMVTLDLGATYEGAIADAARTVIYGEPKSSEHVRLVDTCQNALKAAIKAVNVGVRLGAIGYTIHQTVKNSGFGLVNSYGGHFISDNKPHAEPFVANKSTVNEGIRLQNGCTFAIEPLLTIGDTKTKILSDGWTVVTPGISAHFEDTILIFENMVHNITE